MRLSLWQQFSSNHSASFDVVGTFPTPELAALAAEEIQQTLTQLRDWWQNSEVGRAWSQNNPDDEADTLAPVEIELRQKYGIRWPFSVNWYRWQWDYDQSPVQLYQNHVFIHNPHPYIWHGPQPFDALLERLGGRVAVKVSDSRSHNNEALLLDVVCQLPADELTAWVLYERFKEEFAAAKQAYMSGETIPHQIGFRFRYDHVAAVLAAEDVKVFEAHMEGQRLYLYGLDLGEVYPLGAALPEFIQYLQAEGCTNIEYAFHSTPIVGWRW